MPPKQKEKKTRPARRGASRRPAGPARVRVRMYRQGLGDCFLVTFFGSPDRHFLIDCGTLGATTTGVKMAAVVENIRTTTRDHLDVLVATHEHKDHVSGFGGDPSPFDEFEIDRAWVAWTEDPNEPLARKIAKHKGDLINTIRLAVDALRVNPPADPAERASLESNRSGMRELLGFFADLPPDGTPLPMGLAKTVNEAMRYVTEAAGANGRFLSPGEMIEEKWLPGIRIYVLGPPQNESALRNLGEHGSTELYAMTAQFTKDLAACATFSLAGQPFPAYRESLKPAERQAFEAQLPFDPRFRLEAADRTQCEARFEGYFAADNAWRQIDSDWLSGGSDLALQLDSYTNNTSLVLAIEIIDDGRVLLFPADAQVGNWLSWHEHKWEVGSDPAKKTVTARDLLRRTVFYKVGHHASHNATVKEDGLELMQREDLVAMIPVDRKVALNKNPPWQMPAKALYKRLLEKTRGRVLRSDTGWPPDADMPSEMTDDEWKDARVQSGVTVTDLYIDLELG